MAKNVNLKNNDGDILYPITKSGNVIIDDNNTKLDTKLSEIDTELAKTVRLDGSNQTIEGSIIIQGDLTIQGTTTTSSADSLSVKDAVIVTNADGATLSTFSGLFIKTGTSSGYAMVYDPATDSVILGNGTIDSSNVITISSAERKAITTRYDATSIVDGNLLQWNGTENVLEDSGISKSTIDGKQDALTTDQLTAVNSGITSEKVAQYDDYNDTLTDHASSITVLATAVSSLEDSIANVDTVEANPDDEAEESLNKIKINDKTYFVKDENAITYEEV